MLSRLTLLSASELIQQITGYSDNYRQIIVHFLYYANLRRYGDHEEYRRALEKSDWLLPDGIALRMLWARSQSAGFLDFLRRRKHLLSNIENLNGTDIVPLLLENIAPSSIFLYGSSETINNQSISVLSERFPNHRFAGQDGYHDLDDSQLGDFWSKGVESHPRQILLVGLGSPRQELWIEAHRDNPLFQKTLLISVGGLFDFIGGGEIRAPEWMRRANLEWLYRALSRPQKNLKKTLASLLVFWDMVFYRKR